MSSRQAAKTALAHKVIDVKGTEIERYGQRDVVRELTSRLLSLHPAARDVGEPGMLAVAQLAVLVGANPLPSTNEIHVWVDRGRVTVDLGINYFRRRGNELGGVYWVDDPRLMTEAEYEEYGVDPRQAIGAICKAARLDKIRELISMGIPFEGALKGLARTGVGTVRANATPKNGRPLSWTALKAAEKDLHRALFPNLEQPAATSWLDVVPQREPDDADWPGATIEGMSAVEVENLARAEQAERERQIAWATMTPEERQASAERNSAVLYGDEDFEGFDSDDTQTPNNGRHYAPPAWDDDAVAAGEDLDDDPEPESEPPAKCPTCHATGAAHAPWCKTGTDGARADTRKSNGAGKHAAIRTSSWTKAGQQLAADVPYYQNSDGTPNWYGITGAASKLGHSEITDANLVDVLADLTQYATDQETIAEAGEAGELAIAPAQDELPF